MVTDLQEVPSGTSKPIGGTGMLRSRLTAGDESKAVLKFRAIAAKRIRSDSKKLGIPTSADALAALAPDLDSDEVSASLTALGHGDEYKDLKPMDVFVGARYLFSAKYLTEADARRAVLRTAIVRKVREDTEELGKPITWGSLMALSPRVGPEELREAVDEVLQDGMWPDIKQVVPLPGAAYLYCETYLSEDRAGALARGETLQLKIVEQIRGDSKYLSKLTQIGHLEGLAPDLEPGEIEDTLAEIMKSGECPELGLLSARDGTAYAFSKQFLTEQYAQVLLRITENDPCYTIAQTVREESRLYPRPTNTEIFRYGVFDMDRNKLDEYIVRTQEEYEDIKVLRLSSGDVYLYSSTFMNEDQAEMVAKRRMDG